MGQCLLWQSTSRALAHFGACLTGVGFSLVFPALGVEATRNIAPEMRGRAVGNFIAFFDVAVGLTGPLIGLLVGPAAYGRPFLIGMLAAIGAVVVLLSRR